MGQAGYWSVGVSGNAGPLAPEFGLARGFDVYDASFDSDALHRQRTAWHLASPRADPLIALASLPVFREVAGDAPYVVYEIKKRGSESSS